MVDQLAKKLKDMNKLLNEIDEEEIPEEKVKTIFKDLACDKGCLDENQQTEFVHKLLWKYDT